MIDWARVFELREEVGPDDFYEVIAIFFEEVEETLKNLETSTGNQIARNIHFLKGSALNIGLQGLSDLCKEIEIVIQEGRKPEIGVNDLKAVYTASRDEFLKAV